MIKGTGFEYEKFNFPSGEMHVRVDPLSIKEEIFILFEFEKNEEIIELLLINDALQRLGSKVDTIYVPFIPFARQDRVAVRGECLSIKVFADLLNSIGCKIVVHDAHSSVATALIDNCTEIKQQHIFSELLHEKKDFYLISPDGGALKKIYEIAPMVPCTGIIECTKKRNVSTGEITETLVHFDDDIDGECVIIDDICDGGRTFIEIAKVLKKKGCWKVTLCVTHGLFTKGLEVFDGLIDEIHTRKGKVKWKK